MNRTRLTEQLDVAMDPGEPVTALSGYVHPARGPVSCPAAPLVARWLRDRDRSSGEPADGLPAAGRGGRLFTTTYVDLDGRVVGIAVVAPEHRAALAAEAVRVWSAALRTRRLLVCASPPACGSPPAVPGQPTGRTGSAQEPGRARCPRAEAAAAAVRQYQARGDTVVVLGPTGGSTSAGPEFAGLARVCDVDAGRALQVVDPDRLSYVQHPCAAVEDVTRILAVLRARFPLVRGQHPDQWCYRASDRRHAVLAVARSSDLLLVSDGDTEVPSTGALPIVAYRGPHVLRPEQIASAATIGVIAPLRAGAGAPGDATDEVIATIGGLGPLSVVHHSVLTRAVTDVPARRPYAPADPSTGAAAPRAASP